MRALETNKTSALAEAVDKSMMDSALAMLREPCPEAARTQVALPLRLSGCGLTRASDIAPLASFTGRWTFHVSGSQLVHFPATFCADTNEPASTKAARGNTFRNRTRRDTETATGDAEE